MKNSLFIFLTLLLSLNITVQAQKKIASVSGKVIDEKENPIAQVSVIILGNQKGIATNDSGYFQLNVPADKALALLFSYTGYQTVQQNFILADGEKEQVTIRLEPGT